MVAGRGGSISYEALSDPNRSVFVLRMSYCVRTLRETWGG